MATVDFGPFITTFSLLPTLKRFLLTRFPPPSARMWFPVLTISVSYLLLDAVAALTLSRLIYLGTKNFLRQLYACFSARLQARLASRSAASEAHLLLLGSTTWPSGSPIVPSTQWNGGGIGGTTLPDSGLGSSGVNRIRDIPASLRPRFERTASFVRERRDADADSSTSAQRRDWIAVTDSHRRIEVPVYPEISSLVNVLTYEALETQIGLRLRQAARWITRVIDGTNEVEHPVQYSPKASYNTPFFTAFTLSSSPPQHPPTTRMVIPSQQSIAMTPSSILHQLPEELISHILILAACPSLSPLEPRSCPTNILLLSHRYYNLIIPRLYHSVSLHTPASFRSFRVTLALHNPSLGKFVRRLSIGSSEFDASGYCPSALADHGPLSVGIEQMLLASPHLQELSLDLFSMGALHTGTVSRLEKGPQPTRLCTELTTIPYLSLPTFEDLRELELLVFGMDAATARELRETLPLLEKLELRLVTRRRGSAFQNGRDTWTPEQLPTMEDESEVEERMAEADIQRGSEGGDVFQLESDMQEFVEALRLLRTWPGGDDRLGKGLREITVHAWPSAVRRLKRELEIGGGQVEGGTRVKVELDRGYLLGPRRGAHVLWRKDRARSAWAT
ncbi:hypothetical protein PHSY_004247 [Pseudozyma hubeiensis SY62]|uniref:Uncharacterized protein n=1 Tax=Pseudozyma hubeiensis (strain SY62) TaxID=1305764 RepID=R9P5R1_PSEHS|nr:hypothetical protein PHSY_004247 [Pseudozyma hubeiensis SY62]GAC96664.1 hypothetical protein PHSY_004247 [Pseudozyma hubeiensis SY62]